MTVRKITATSATLLIDVGQGAVEAVPAPAARAGVICADSLSMTAIMAAWLSSIAVLQQAGARRELLGQRLQPVAERGGALARARQSAVRCRLVLGEIDHDRDGLLDRVDVPSRFVGGVGRERQIEGIGGDQAGGERLARLRRATAVSSASRLPIAPSMMA